MDKIEENKVIEKKLPQLNAESFGLVAYAESNYYKETREENLLLPMPVNIREFLLSVETHFNGLLANTSPKVQNILAGHEHGAEEGKAHFQCLVELTSIARITKRPAVLIINDVRSLIMFQAAIGRNSLRKYCAKDGAYQWLHEIHREMVYKKNKKGEDTQNLDVFQTIARNRTTLSSEEATNLVLMHEPKSFFMGHKNVSTAIAQICTEMRPKFEWQWPVHMCKVEYSFIYRWFTEYCMPSKLRRKALLLYSNERGTGKTQFAQSLINDEAYSVIFRANFTPMPPGKDPKLLILDDMSWTGGDEKKEVWKALIAGEPTAIRDAYVNFPWPYRVPCIITTNNRKLVKFLMKSIEFNTQIMFYQVKQYLGPDGTRPDKIDIVEQEVDNELINEIQEETLVLETKSRNFNVAEWLQRTQNLQRIGELELLLEKSEKEIKDLKRRKLN